MDSRSGSTPASAIGFPMGRSKWRSNWASNPKKLGKLDNHGQEPWKLPVPAFIEKLYRKRSGKDRPDAVL